MKKTMIALMALAGVAMASQADVDAAITEFNWTFTDNGNGTGTWTTTVLGGFNADLGEAAIKDGESFTLSVIQSASSWANDYGTGMISTGDPYAGHGGNDDFRYYIGRTGTSNAQMTLQVNGWEYNQNRVDGYVNGSSQNPSQQAPLTLGFTFKFVNNADAEAEGNWPSGGDGQPSYIVLSAMMGSDMIFDPKTDGNVVRSFNYSHLQNVSTQAGLPADVATTISITKAYTAPTPEPATATLSLLALAGLASRRRRH